MTGSRQFRPLSHTGRKVLEWKVTYLLWFPLLLLNRPNHAGVCLYAQLPMLGVCPYASSPGLCILGAFIFCPESAYKSAAEQLCGVLPDLIRSRGRTALWVEQGDITLMGSSVPLWPCQLCPTSPIHTSVCSPIRV